MSVQREIETRLAQAFEPSFLEVVNESHMHNVPPGSESHFKVTVVSERFADAALVARHRLVNAALSEQLAGPVHALALHTLTPDEWFERAGRVADSPQCLGGGRH